MKVKDTDVIEVLEGTGIPLGRWFAIDACLVGYLDDDGRVMMQIIENDSLAAAASKFLRTRGQVHVAAVDDGRA